MGQLIFYEDTVDLKAPTKGCFEQAEPTSCSVPTQKAVEPRDVYRHVLDQYGGDNVTVVKYHEALCQSQYCDGFVPGTRTLLIRDTTHLTAAGQYYLDGFVCPQ